MIRAVLYDHDGTLVDSLPLVVAATNRVLIARGLPALPAHDIIEGMHVATRPRMGLHAGSSDPLEQDRLAQAFYDEARAIGDDYARPYDGVAAMIEAIATRGMAQGVVSNNQGALIRGLMAHAGLGGRFAAILGEEDFAAPKPDPSGLLAGADRLGVDPRDCVYVGDTIGDLRAAIAAGMRCIGCLWGISPASAMTGVGFSALIAHPTELPATLSRLSG
ncbi:MAG: HAD family hydrolase [Planctomycetes bacterium]|nr:HAD family hydrolase [Planctomycetota bacterium]